MNGKIRLAMCDDIEYLCEYFKSVFENEEGIDFVGMAHGSRQCVEMVKNLKPDVLLLDMQLETNVSGLTVIPEIKQACPECKIIMLTIHDEEDSMYNAMLEGADNYLLKTTSVDKIIASVYEVVNDNILMPIEVSRKLFGGIEKNRKRQASMLYMVQLIKKLSRSELEVLSALCSGASYKKLAEERFVSIVTIRSQVSRLLKKCEYTNLEDLLRDIKELNILDLFGEN